MCSSDLVYKCRADSPVHGYFASSALFEDFCHCVLAVLYVVAVADIDCGIDFVFQCSSFRHGGYLDGFVYCCIYGSVFEEVGRDGCKTILCCCAHAGAFFGVPSQHDVASRFHVFEHFAEQHVFVRDAWVEINAGCSAGCSYVVYVRNERSFADEESVCASAPVVVI